MMIDQLVFLEEIGILMDWFEKDFEEATLKRLHQRLSQHLSTEEFKLAANQVFDTAKFFPRVCDFVSAIKGDPETQALKEWEQCIKAAAWNDKEMIAHLSTQGQSALHLVGGLYKLGMATEDELKWVKKEFVSTWKSWSTAVNPVLPSASAISVLPQGVGDEMSEAVRSLSLKMSLNGSSKA